MYFVWHDDILPFKYSLPVRSTLARTIPYYFALAATHPSSNLVLDGRRYCMADRLMKASFIYSLTLSTSVPTASMNGWIHLHSGVTALFEEESEMETLLHFASNLC